MVFFMLSVFGSNRSSYDGVYCFAAAATHFFRERIKAIAGAACIDINAE